ncbi:MAG: hypothetical protein Q9182_000993 [Xanthomendoza sp. 2 TL-2023]
MDRGRDRSVLHLTIPTVHQTELQDLLAALTVIETIGRLHAGLVLLHTLIPMLLQLEVVGLEVVHHHDAVHEVLPRERDMMEVDTVAEQDPPQHELLPLDEIATSDHPLGPVVLPDLHLLELDRPFQ